MSKVVLDRCFAKRGLVYVGLLCFTACGESEPQGTIAGRVTLKGESVTSGTIVFSSTETGTHLTAPISNNGSYLVTASKGKGLPIGLYQVFLYPQLTPTPGPWRQPGPDVAPPKFDPRWPSRYYTPDSSNLSLVVVPGVNRFDVDLVP